MALYTPPSLPHSPSSYSMNPTLPPLPIELLHTWSSWRPPKPEVPLTPPLSSAPPRRVLQSQPRYKTVLPPITHFDHAMSRNSPVTPPQHDGSYHWHSAGPASHRVPAPLSPPAEPHPPIHYTAREENVADDPPEASPELNLNWFTDIESRSSQYIAEKTCEMICYLWFSSLSQSSSPSKKNRMISQDQKSYIPPSNPSTASLQFSVAPAFVRFMQKVLETTQVSQSVIVLSLHYIYRMKARNRFTSGQAGSEYRVAIAALMMANKFVDDNTYTNKTWSEVSGINLIELNKMEKEFLLGIDFGLYVDESTYESWLNLLQGLVMAKERELQNWRRSWRPTRSLHRTPSQQIYYESPQQQHVQYAIPSLQPGSKRTASDAFYPDAAAYARGQAQVPRRSTGLTLQIPELEYSSGQSSESSASPMESLQSFSKLSLGASPVDAGTGAPWVATVPGQHEVPQTLASAYHVDDRRQYAVPQHLYFYTLTCSPADADGSNARKGRLRYHQPHPTQLPPLPMQPDVPMVVQSASASPYDMSVRLPRAHVLPPFSELSRVWARQNQAVYAVSSGDVQQGCQPLASDAIPSAQFANAGPPGFQYYATPAPVAYAPYYEVRGRRL
ncbi:hypothetical protein POSPLADRAFT_1064398 [Postia placenta MAD-698-R-SB12]|uniref:Cyclin-like domain-containing protein n=1 Tax=Postia placenta MAD-698-R-SB12 TaxID=670580 RepID=A0A1X6NHA5_9APHY|nr:hypothetical protein POSPLADRAFT_1064398 [Postia placenta MAD-698-R-SB12]OSX68028.1 hypothetical protein POSPLADRAFT_1064398 [Postia placenta MAD-698-R-SB12]